MEYTVCEVCGDIGFKHLLVCCRDCTCSVVHQYCLDKVVFDASLVEWFCYECVQSRGEVTCRRTLEKVSSERPPCHAQFCSTAHQTITNRVETARDAGPWSNNIDSGADLSSQHTYGENQTNCHISVVSESTRLLWPSTLQNHAVDKVMPFSPNDGPEKVLSCICMESTPTVQEGNADFIDTASSYGHGTVEASERSKKYTERQVDSSEKTVEMATTSSSSEESGEDIGADFVLSRTSNLSEAQKQRIIAFTQQTKPEITVFVAMMRKSNVQPPGPSLGISKEYASAHFPHKSTNVTLQTPGKSKKWHPIFYKRNESRKNMLMGQWLHFVRDNHVEEGDICLIEPVKGGEKSIFMVYLLHARETCSKDGAGFQKANPCSGRSSAKKMSEVHIKKQQPTNEESLSDESLDSEDYVRPSRPPYIVPCRNGLSKSQKKIIEEKARDIRSEVPICVAVMKNNNVGVAQKWMLELGSRYASVHLPARGQTIMLQCGRKVWENKMVIHNGRRWFLNGGWPKFARDNDLRVVDICLFELRKNRTVLTMTVHIISREKF